MENKVVYSFKGNTPKDPHEDSTTTVMAMDIIKFEGSAAKAHFVIVQEYSNPCKNAYA